MDSEFIQADLHDVETGSGKREMIPPPTLQFQSQIMTVSPQLFVGSFLGVGQRAGVDDSCAIPVACCPTTLSHGWGVVCHDGRPVPLQRAKGNPLFCRSVTRRPGCSFIFMPAFFTPSFFDPPDFRVQPAGVRHAGPGYFLVTSSGIGRLDSQSRPSRRLSKRGGEVIYEKSPPCVMRCSSQPSAGRSHEGSPRRPWSFMPQARRVFFSGPRSFWRPSSNPRRPPQRSSWSSWKILRRYSERAERRPGWRNWPNGPAEKTFGIITTLSKRHSSFGVCSPTLDLQPMLFFAAAHCRGLRFSGGAR